MTPKLVTHGSADVGAVFTSTPIATVRISLGCLPKSMMSERRLVKTQPVKIGQQEGSRDGAGRITGSAKMVTWRRLVTGRRGYNRVP